MKPIKHLLATLVLAATFLLGSSAFAADGPPKRLIIKYHESSSQIDVTRVPEHVTMRYLVRLKHVRRMGLKNHHVFRLDRWLDASALGKLIADLRADPRIEQVEEDKLLKANLTPNDSRYNEQWHYFQAGVGINMPAAWDKSTGDSTVVAVIDTGYTDHSDLDANMLPGYDFISDPFVANDGDGRDADASDPGDAYAFGECGVPGGASSSWHGTHVSGTVAAVTNNGLGVAGVAFDASILPLRALGKCGGYTSDIADSVIWASGGSVAGVADTTTPAQVINMSLGGSGSTCGFAMQLAINQAVSNGTAVVVAAGNSNANASNATPANCDNVITVAANDRDGNKASYSNYGAVVDIAAPGGETNNPINGVLSTLNSGNQEPVNESYEFYQGTSMASPHVAGVAALLYAVKPDATPQQIADAITSTAQPFPGSCPQGCGAGIVDASAAIDAIGNVQPPPVRLFRRNLSGAGSSWLIEQVEVPANSRFLFVRTKGGTGDADLYVRFGAQPTDLEYDCRPALAANDETCILPNPQPGTWYIGIRGNQDYSGVNLIAISRSAP